MSTEEYLHSQYCIGAIATAARRVNECVDIEACSRPSEPVACCDQRMTLLGTIIAWFDTASTVLENLSDIRSDEEFECPICCEKMNATYQLPKLIECSDRHDICSPCFIRYLQQAMENAQDDIPCPYKVTEQCTNGHLTDIEIQAFVSHESYVRYKTFREMRADLTLRDCPKCRAICQGTPEVPEMKCGSCCAEFCYFHMDSHPSGKGNCANYVKQQNNKENYLSESFIKKISKPCPFCKASIEKNGGCPHMTCTACKREWCWICSQSYEPGHICLLLPFTVEEPDWNPDSFEGSLAILSIAIFTTQMLFVWIFSVVNLFILMVWATISPLFRIREDIVVAMFTFLPLTGATLVSELIWFPFGVAMVALVVLYKSVRYRSFQCRIQDVQGILLLPFQVFRRFTFIALRKYIEAFQPDSRENLFYEQFQENFHLGGFEKVVAFFVILVVSLCAMVLGIPVALCFLVTLGLSTIFIFLYNRTSRVLSRLESPLQISLLGGYDADIHVDNGDKFGICAVIVLMLAILITDVLWLPFGLLITAGLLIFSSCKCKLNEDFLNFMAARQYTYSTLTNVLIFFPVYLTIRFMDDN